MTLKKDTSIVKEFQKVLLDDKDFLKNMLADSLQIFLQDEFNRFIKAGPYERSNSRRSYRNGSYTRSVKTRIGHIELEVCRDRDGLFQTELFRRYQRSEQALVLSMIDMYVNGVSTRKVSRIVEELCGHGVSKSQVSELSKDLDTKLNQWRGRKLIQSYPFLVVDARYEHIRTKSGMSTKAVMIVIGISDEGYREVLSIDIGDSENEVDWGDVFKRLKDRGLSGVKYVVSDHHQGLVNALKRHFQGALWQRSQVHFIRNFITKLGRKDSKKYLALLKDIFSAASREDAAARKDRLVEILASTKPAVSGWIDENIESCFSVYSLPVSHRRKMRSTNMLERLNQELKRRSRVIRIFPNEESCIRLLGTLCMEQSEEWQTGRRYLKKQDDPDQDSDERWIWPEELNLASAMLQPDLT
jgi:transposase-like protein